MSFNDNVPKLKPYSRSVSIIGVGATPFVRVLDDPAVDGLCEPELFGYAAREMKDTILALLDEWKEKQPPELGKPNKKKDMEK